MSKESKASKASRLTRSAIYQYLISSIKINTRYKLSNLFVMFNCLGNQYLGEQLILSGEFHRFRRLRYKESIKHKKRRNNRDKILSIHMTSFKKPHIPRYYNNSKSLYRRGIGKRTT